MLLVMLLLQSFVLANLFGLASVPACAINLLLIIHSNRHQVLVVVQQRVHSLAHDLHNGI